MAHRPQFKKKIDPFYRKQWWITMIMLMFQATLIPVMLYGLLVTTMMTILYALCFANPDDFNIPDLLFYLSLFAMKEKIITCSYCTTYSMKLSMTLSFRLIFSTVESIINTLLLPVIYTLFRIFDKLVIHKFTRNMRFTKFILLIFCYLTIPNVDDETTGPTDNIIRTPSRGKGRPKGTPKKSKGFRGKTPNKVNTSLTHSNDISNRPIGLVNIANDCFFNSVVQALFSLESFRNYVASFEPQILHEIEPVRAMQKVIQRY